MNFSNVSKELNEKLTIESQKAVKTKKPNKTIIAALLEAVAEIDPVAKAGSFGLVATLTTDTKNIPSCTFLAKNPKSISSYPNDDCSLYPPYGSILSGADTHTLFVLQSEYGVVVPPLGSDNSAPQAFIASADATSCLLVGARAHLVGAQQQVSATAIGHFDCCGEDLIQGMMGLYVKSLLPAIGDQIRLANALSGGSKSATTVSVEWYIVGGLINDEHTLPCLSDLFAHFFLQVFAKESLIEQGQIVSQFATTDVSVDIHHSLRPDAQCFWSLNTFKDSQKRETCIIRGLRINALDGTSEPFEMRANDRNLCFGHTRGSRCVTQPMGSEAVLPLLVRPHDGNMKCRLSTCEPEASATTINAGPEKTVNFVQFLQAIRTAIAKNQPIPVIVHPAHLDKVHKGYRSITEEQAGMMSTTPHCEPIDYASEFAPHVRYVAIASSQCVFGNPALPLTNLI